MPRILIVDDEEQVRALLSLVFRRAGWETETAGGAEEALERLRSAVFDVVLSDVVMTGMYGHEMAHRIAQDTSCCPLVVFISGSTDPDCPECPFVPKCPFIPKPFQPVDLLATVSRLLRETRPTLRKSGPDQRVA